VFIEVEEKFEQSKKIIQFLNSLSKKDLKAVGFQDRTELVIDVSKIIDKGDIIKAMKLKIVEVKGEIEKF
jgi:hypothetical protein